MGAAAVLSAIVVVATAALFFSTESRELIGHLKKNPLRTNGPARISMDQGMQLLLPPFSKARRRNTVDLGKNTPLFSFATYDILFRGGGRNCSKCARRRSRGRPHAVSLIGQLPFRLRQYPPPFFSSIDVFSPRRFDP